MQLNVVITLLTLLLVTNSCSSPFGTYGRVSSQSGDETRVTIEELVSNWHRYDVYYSGISYGHMRGLIFDPKGDYKAMEGDRWVRVEDRETLSKAVGWIRSNIQFPARLMKVTGPDRKFYGYVYTGVAHVVTRLVGENRLYVYDLTSDPGVYGGGPG
jgi:hypothetical protein